MTGRQGAERPREDSVATAQEPLASHLLRARQLQAAGSRAGYGRVELPFGLDRKYPHADQEWGWQYVSPSANISTDPRSGARRRHHAYESARARAVKQATRAAKITKRVIDKKQVMERIRGDIIKYSRYDREFDAFRIYGDTVVVIGSETVVPTPDANRADAGKTIHRRFTEVWLRREGRWDKVVRHASNISSE